VRTALQVWCALGALAIGVKAHLDRTVLQYPDVAIEAGAEAYFIPRHMVKTDGWTADLKRLVGCWDAREEGVVPLAAPLANCHGANDLPLTIPAKELGPEAEFDLHNKPLQIKFWRAYTPPDDHLPQLAAAWAGTGKWAGRRLILRADWQLFRIEAAGTPWVYLLNQEPQRGDIAELATLYAGRCHRPDAKSDAGMTCNFVFPVGPKAAIEYSLAADQMMSIVPLREGLMSATSAWRKPALSVSRSPGQAVAQNSPR
jgi:hypothetical protein